MDEYWFAQDFKSKYSNCFTADSAKMDDSARMNARFVLGLVSHTGAYSLCCYVGGENFKCLKFSCGHVISHVWKDSEQLTSFKLVYCHAGLSVLLGLACSSRDIGLQVHVFLQNYKILKLAGALEGWPDELWQISVIFLQQGNVSSILNWAIVSISVLFCPLRVCVVHSVVFRSREAIKHRLDPSCEYKLAEAMSAKYRI